MKQRETHTQGEIERERGGGRKKWLPLYGHLFIYLFFIQQFTEERHRLGWAFAV